MRSKRQGDWKLQSQVVEQVAEERCRDARYVEFDWEDGADQFVMTERTRERPSTACSRRHGRAPAHESIAQ